MRRSSHLVAASLLALGLMNFSADKASACIKFDRGAEMALLDEAIASSKTSEPNKAVLRALRKEILVFRAKSAITSDDVVQHHWLTTEALKLIGKERIVWNGESELDVGVFKQTKSTRKAGQKSAEAPQGAAFPACG
jgi:hypothetical protein